MSNIENVRPDFGRPWPLQGCTLGVRHCSGHSETRRSRLCRRRGTARRFRNISAVTPSDHGRACLDTPGPHPAGLRTAEGRRRERDLKLLVKTSDLETYIHAYDHIYTYAYDPTYDPIRPYIYIYILGRRRVWSYLVVGVYICMCLGVGGWVRVSGSLGFTECLEGLSLRRPSAVRR